MEQSAVKIGIVLVALMSLATVIAADSGGEELLDPARSIETSDGGLRRIIIVAKEKGSAKTNGSELRLPRSVLPRSYDVTLLPILEEGNFSSSGTVDILVDCLENTDTVTLHAADIEMDYASISIVDVASNQPLGVTTIIEDQNKQFLIISCSSVLSSGRRYRLSMKFTSFLKDELRGFYRTSYVENGQTKYLAVSQMQPTDARRAFPCFDEPNMKANFSMRLGRRVTQLSTSNMPLVQSEPIPGMDCYMWDQFETSLPMSTYLVAMLVADFVFLESPPELSDTRFRIWARPEAISQAEYASRIGPQVLTFFEQYFQIPFPLKKQDMAAVPDLSFGAMENWGLVTYRETTLLFDPIKSSESDKERVASVVAHELAHQWFGDLVTMDWWSDLWLNEGFASYIEYLGVDHVEPDFEIVDQIVLNDVQDVFAVDALESSHPISVEVNDPKDINELFDRISYGKGASIIRMLNKFLGDDTFRKGLTVYLNSRKYGNAVQDDLWQALTQQAMTDNITLPVDIKSIMDTWTLRMGYPVVTVERNYSASSATLTQSRFLLNPATNSSDMTVYSWWIPLVHTSNFSLPSTSSWLPFNQQAASIQLAAAPNQWVIFNVDQVGYYRVNYDATNWNLIHGQLQTDHRRISRINRAQIMDDSLNIARANLLAYAYPLDISQYLVNEVDYIPWESSLRAFAYIDLMLVQTQGYAAFQAYLASLITPLYNYVHFDETVGDSHLLIYTRVTALSWACKLNVGDCASNSAQIYRSWMSDPSNTTIISANYKRSIACTAVASGGQNEWDFAYEQYLSTNVAAEKSTMLYAMSCSEDTAVLSRMLEWAINSTSGIRRSDASSVFRNVGSNSAGRSLAFDFLRNRWPEMVAYFPSLYDLARIVDSISTGFNTELQVAQLKEFQAEHADELGTAARAVAQAIERAEANVNWMDLHYKEIVDWLAEHSF